LLDRRKSFLTPPFSNGRKSPLGLLDRGNGFVIQSCRCNLLCLSALRFHFRAHPLVSLPALLFEIGKHVAGSSL
jgi:hypothetical protein